MMASPATAAAPEIVTAEQLLAMEDGDAYELVDGVLEERCVSEVSSLLASYLNHLLWVFVDPRRLGAVLDSSIGLRIFRDRPNRVPRPDVAFVSYGRRRTATGSRGYLTVPPELVVEVVSPGDNASALETKLSEYFSAGVLLAWLVYPEARTVHVFTPGREAARLAAGDTLTGGDVLPGFEVAVDQIFAVLDEPPAE